jgi:hypothetical protein
VTLARGPRDVTSRETGCDRIGDVAETGTPQVSKTLGRDDELGTHEASRRPWARKASSLSALPPGRELPRRPDADTHLLLQDETGGMTTAVVLSLLITAKVIGLVPQVYFRDVSLRLAKCSDVSKLTPHGWKEHFAQQVQRDRRDSSAGAPRWGRGRSPATVNSDQRSSARPGRAGLGTDALPQSGAVTSTTKRFMAAL